MSEFKATHIWVSKDGLRLPVALRGSRNMGTVHDAAHWPPTFDNAVASYDSSDYDSDPEGNAVYTLTVGGKVLADRLVAVKS